MRSDLMRRSSSSYGLDRRIGRGELGSGRYRVGGFGPHVDAFTQFLSAMHPHLLAAIALPRRQDPDLSHIETGMLRDPRENQINGDRNTGISHIIVDHDKRGTGFE